MSGTARGSGELTAGHRPPDRQGVPRARQGAPKDRQIALRDALLDAVLAKDGPAATGLVVGALDEGADPEGLLLEVIAAVQRRIGEHWAANEISVAQEHAATAVNERAVAALADHRTARAARTAASAAGRGRIAVACVDGEWHALPARLLTEVLRLRGWQVDFLGPQVPSPRLIAHLHTTRTDTVALSGSISTRLPAAHAAITACQAVGVPVLTGGAAFGPDGRYARLLGADAWAPDARTAADLLAAEPLPRPLPDHQPLDDLPHLSDQEYTLVTRNGPALVRTVLAGLEDAWPAMRAYSDVQRERTAEDLAHIVDFLATALYLDDEALFTSFIGWTRQVLTARGVPAHSLPPALGLLVQELKDFPRATRLLRHGLRELAHRHTTPKGKTA
ncbi:B12-binding domain-containing protein [Kitasatospora sp. NPDC096147]|uniref:cobalamin B12-binding domain-containing protein n=1 Tax=Kitasatospora sp. NPDC096147 TaxID=3364093 RepID=UPI00382CD27E